MDMLQGCKYLRTYVSRLAQRHENVHYAWLYMRPRHYVVIHTEINYV